ncbi:peptidase M50 [Fimbriimonas ginsengisoli Gsoil 348]|uniref:Peptidase M50 n=2 Tax=Fimbriimonas ginsengisoli TaxID=1005039 RepID=A0A068NSD6_FIMGI|nr:peptidase M50 [Fimbriimonas ginsengisoli Gsoil 348]
MDLFHGIEYAALIVFSILCHELGHALTAKRLGMSGLSIMLHGFGGFATSSGYRNPTQRLKVVLAGPAVTFALGLICLGLGTLGSGLGSELGYQLFLIHFVGVINIWMGFLNLVPSLPWDGGQALQAILEHKHSEFKAMRAVAHLGLIITPPIFIYSLVAARGFAELFAAIGFITSLMTLLSSGGVKFGEFAADRRSRKEEVAFKQQSRARNDAYIEEVYERERQRDEKERLRKLFEGSGKD